MRNQEAGGFEHRRQVIIWAVMVCAAGVYFVLPHLLSPSSTVDSPAMVNASVVLACVLTGVSFAVKAAIQARARETNKPGLRRAALVLALILCEAAVILGLAVWLAAGSPRYIWPMAAGSAGLLLHFPRHEE